MMSQFTDVSGAAPKSIRKKSLHDQVADRIRDMIVEGVLPPGTRIDETRLIEELGVSRTPFREAVRTLAAEGLVVMRPSRGNIVRELTPEDVFGMLEVLAHLERLAGRLATDRASDAEIADMVALHERMLDCHRAGDRLGYFKLNQEFHSGLAALSGNETLQEMQGILQGRLKRVRYAGNRTAGYWAEAAAEHGEMVAALQARDGERLGEALARHLQNTWERVRDSV